HPVCNLEASHADRNSLTLLRRFNARYAAISGRTAKPQVQTCAPARLCASATAVRAARRNSLSSRRMRRALCSKWVDTSRQFARVAFTRKRERTIPRLAQFFLARNSLDNLDRETRGVLSRNRLTIATLRHNRVRVVADSAGLPQS